MTAQAIDHPHALPAPLIVACAAACGVIVANLYYAQPLVALIAPALKIGPGLGGAIVTLTQLGYAAGLLFIVPLADRLENKRLILTTLGIAALALAALAAAPSAGLFLIASAFVGCFSAGAQVIVPLTATLSHETTRGRTIGNVMSGLLAGIMLARPVASVIAAAFGWRAVFWLSAGLMLVMGGWLWKALPERRPAEGDSYGRILASMVYILGSERALQRRAIYQGLCFAIFNIFWTASPLVLAQKFGFNQNAIALFALAGAGGALAAPLAGRLGDRGHVRLGTLGALLTIATSCLLSDLSVALRFIPALVLFAITLDAGTQVNQVLGQGVIYAIRGEARGRINAIYMTTIFVLGAGGSAIATLAYHAGGWNGAMLTAVGIGGVNLLLFSTEFLGKRPR